MNNFKINIPQGNKLFDFQFSKIACPASKYFVEVNLDKATVVSFEMQKDHYNKWKVTHPVPEWIINLELQLAQAIYKNNLQATIDF